MTANIFDLLNEVKARNENASNERPFRPQAGTTAFYVVRSDAPAGFAAEVTDVFVPKGGGEANKSRRYAMQIVFLSGKLPDKMDNIDKGVVVPALMPSSVYESMLKQIAAGVAEANGIEMSEDLAMLDGATLTDVDADGKLTAGSVFLLERNGSGLETKYEVRVASDKQLAKLPTFATVELMSKTLMEWVNIYQQQQDSRLAKSEAPTNEPNDANGGIF